MPGVFPSPRNPQKQFLVYSLTYCLPVLLVTLYPFHFHFNSEYFQMRIHGIDWFPFHTRPVFRESWRLWMDFADNLILFMPFGFLGHRALGGKPWFWKVAGILILTCLFSSGIEFVQLFAVSRYTTFTDVVYDTLGAAIGVVIATRRRGE